MFDLNFNNAPTGKVIPLKKESNIDLVDAYAQEMAKHGLRPPKGIIADGKIHRFPDGKSSNKNAFYILHSHQDQFYGGCFGSWSRDIKITWNSSQIPGLSMSDIERERVYQAQQKAVKQVNDVLKKQHKEASKKAQYIWDNASIEIGKHPYLENKQIEPCGARLSRGSLIIPWQDKDNNVWTLQFIQADGSKTFLKGGKRKGTFYTIKGNQDRFL